MSREFLHQTHPATIFDIASTGSYADAYAGGEVGALSQSPTISAIGYTNILTGTWMNKHNVQGNSNIKTNYNYWSLFRIAKAQQRDVKTALFSSWADNRTLLIGEGRPETNNVRVDYAYDGYDLDTLQFPRKPRELQIYDIDSVVIGNADICNLTTTGFDNKVILKWQTLTSTTDNAEVYVSTTNNYREGGKDTWQRIGTTKASDCTYTVDLDALPKSKLYKFVVVTPSNHITRWFTHKIL